MCTPGIATYFSINNAVGRSSETMQVALADSVATTVEADQMGNSHLKDLAGSDVSTRSFGDSFTAKVKYDPFSGRELNCISINSVAGMHSDVKTQTDVGVAIMDKSGFEKKIVATPKEF